jgi:hypothetical protein
MHVQGDETGRMVEALANALLLLSYISWKTFLALSEAR